MVIYWCFDLEGGFFQNPSYPSPSPIWIILPTIEGVAYAVFIAWYDNSFVHPATGVSKFIGRIGEYSYSIYLLHFFVVSPATRFLKNHVMDISNFYVACTWAFIFFVLMMLPGYVSFRFIEQPFLRLRKSYVKAFGNGREVRLRDADRPAYRTR
jgi:peptidoglycan/LPS O-acetylase OafA/YrhL